MKWTKEQLTKLRKGEFTAADVPASEFPMPSTVDNWLERVAAFLNGKHLLIQLMHETNEVFGDLAITLFDKWAEEEEEHHKTSDMLEDAQKKIAAYKTENAALQKKKRGLLGR